MTPEQLVPTLETCKLLKEAGYKQGSSLLAWFDVDLIVLNVSPKPLVFDTRIAAPTLQELLEDIALVEYREVELERIGKWWCACAWGIDRKKYHEQSHSNPAEAAALLWLELHKEVSNG